MPAAVRFDLNYNVTSSLKAAVSVNTDFAETEVNRRRVNLTRFPLFFPEQHDFFLENASVFNFSPASRVIPFFSRQIGLADGMEVPIIFGSRLTGQADSYDLGFLQVRTDESDELGGEDFTVGRVKRNWAPRPERWKSVRQLEFGILYEHLLDLDNVLHTRQADFTLLQVRYQSGDNFSIRNNNRFERLDDSFEISDGVTLPVGEYRFSELRFDARSANQRPVSGHIGYTLGDFWSGSRRSSESACRSGRCRVSRSRPIGSGTTSPCRKGSSRLIS